VGIWLRMVPMLSLDPSDSIKMELFLKNIFKIFKTQVYNLIKAVNVFLDFFFFVLIIVFQKIQS
jgi:hypothetical protein